MDGYADDRAALLEALDLSAATLVGHFIGDGEGHPEASGVPYTIIRSTQFLEFLRSIAAESTDGNTVMISPGMFQPIAADDVAAIVADVALAPSLTQSHERELVTV